MSRAKQLLELRETFRQKLRKGKSANPLALVDHLCTYPVITIPYASHALGVTYNGARKIVDKLIEAEILAEIPGRAWNKLYWSEPIVDVLH